ncbi:helix-turn-helix transcriptional regulator [Flavobacterium sp. H122]|uniref:ArsR/SmtB family transcription factor n=1 Tax=Flavobacterium sp. H122 TaxID=2529860 RepID=UPI0010A9A5D6|nr:metalloregulator ArsR/SmtB family transcription factor [Flavobacterium sp. H122]
MRRDPFQAIADPSRRAIVSLLILHAMTPNALAEHFNTTRQAVSKHIKILTECELVKPRPDGREIFYELNPVKLKEIADWLAPFKQLWEARFNELDTILEQLKNKQHE